MTGGGRTTLTNLVNVALKEITSEIGNCRSDYELAFGKKKGIRKSMTKNIKDK